jgi:hypothetical protein
MVNGIKCHHDCLVYKKGKNIFVDAFFLCLIFYTHTQKSLANGPTFPILGGSFLENATLITSPGALIHKEARRGALKSQRRAVSSSDPLNKQQQVIAAAAVSVVAVL